MFVWCCLACCCTISPLLWVTAVFDAWAACKGSSSRWLGETSCYLQIHCACMIPINQMPLIL